MFVSILFYIFASLIIIAAFNVIISKNSVYASLWLALTFVISACMWMLMQAEFLAVILLMVYVGAVMVMFLFVIMMFNVNYDEIRKGFWKRLPFSLLIGFMMILAIVLVILNPKADIASFGTMLDVAKDYNSVYEIGKALITEYLFAFELASVILLLGMVAAIALAYRESFHPKRPDPNLQVMANKESRMRIVKMKAEVINNKTNEESDDDA